MTELRIAAIVLIIALYALLLHVDHKNTYVDCSELSQEQITFIESAGRICEN